MTFYLTWTYGDQCVNCEWTGEVNFKVKTALLGESMPKTTLRHSASTQASIVIFGSQLLLWKAADYQGRMFF